MKAGLTNSLTRSLLGIYVGNMRRDVNPGLLQKAQPEPFTWIDLLTNFNSSST